MSLIGLALVSALLLQQPPALPSQAIAQPPQATAAATKGTAELRGRVIDESGAPVAGVTVRIATVFAQRESVTLMTARTATTDEAGRFVFADLAAGHYSPSVMKNGVATTGFALGGVTRAQAIDVADGAKVNCGDLRMLSGVSISGQILDDKGSPLAGATVSAWGMRYLSPGERRLNFAGQATSDQAGDYRIDGLKPGRYYVDAKASESKSPTFYPGTATATSAALVDVSNGSGAASISIRLVSIPLAKISGSVINSNGVASPEVAVFLSPQRDDGAQVSVMNLFTEVDAAGKFAIDKVPPGVYVVAAVSKSRLEKIASTGGGGVGEQIEGAESGVQTITVDGANIDDLVIRTTPPVSISGKFTLDGSGVTAALAKRLTLRTSDNAGPGGVQSVMNATFGEVAPDGSFRMPIVAGGRLLHVQGLPSGVSLRRIMVNGIDATDEGFDVNNSDIRDVVVELTSKPSQVDGRVSNSQGALMGNVSVLVFPADERKWQFVLTRLIKTMKTDKNGAFSVSALPPGSYYAIALPSLAEGEWAEPSNLQKLRSAATAFKLADGEHATLALTMRNYWPDRQSTNQSNNQLTR